MRSQVQSQINSSKINSENISGHNRKETQLSKEEAKDPGNSFRNGRIQDASGSEENPNLLYYGVQNFAKISILPSSHFQLQPKLKINSPDDKYEQEANHMAEQVMRIPEQGVQRKCAKCGKEDEIQPTSSVKIQRKCAKCEHDDRLIQTKSNGNSGNVASSEFMNQIQKTKGGGHTMDANTRSFMEPRFGMDFSKVRIHTDTQAAGMSQEINAKAFTTGTDIYFNRGGYNPGTIEGKKLLAHELTHVVQQNSVRPNEIQRFSLDRFFGGGTFSNEELTTYLAKITKEKKIEDNYDSDNKARKIVEKWKNLDADFILSPLQRALLIKEMLSGFTGDDDEQAILALLEGSENAALSKMFGEYGLNKEDLDSAFHFAEQDQLDEFFDKRISTGKDNKLIPKGTQTEFANCPKNLMDDIKVNLSVARNKLDATIQLLKKEPTSEFVKNALYLYFRSSTDQTKTTVITKMQNASAQFDRINFKCEARQDKDGCDKKTIAHVGDNNPVTICNKKYLNFKRRDEVLVHEAMHLFNPDVIDFGYFGEENCEETAPLGSSSGGASKDLTAGDPPSERMNNADSYACFITQLMHPQLKGKKADEFKEDIKDQAESFRGSDIVLKRDGVHFGNVIKLNPDPITGMDEFDFKVDNAPKASGFIYNWYLHLENDPNKKLAIDNKERTMYLGKVAGELKKKKVKEATIICEVMLYRGGPIKTLKLKVKFDHSELDDSGF